MNERDFDQLVASVKQAGAIKRGKLKPGRTIQAPRAAGDMTMPLTRDFRETVQARAERDPAFREGLLKEGIECLLAGDVDTGKDGTA